MAIQLAKIVKGALRKIKRQPAKSGFQPISWWLEKRLKHEEDKQIKELRISKLKIIYKRPYEVLHTYKELFEDEIYKFAASTSSPLIIDCGANIGLSVLYFKNLYPGTIVFAFEPDPANFALLEQNVAKNNLSNVSCRQEAVWIANETLSFASDGTQASQITKDGQQKNAVQVAAIRLADVLKDNKVDFLKIDIEGAELDVLQDCEPYLQNVENLFVEYHGKTSETEKLFQLVQLLKGHYKVYLKLAADNLQHPFVTKTTTDAFDVQLNIFCYK